MATALRHASCLDRSEPRCGGYVPRRPETTPLYAALSAEVETFLARREDEERALPRFVARELRGYLDCTPMGTGRIANLLSLDHFTSPRSFLRVTRPCDRDFRLQHFLYARLQPSSFIVRRLPQNSVGTRPLEALECNCESFVDHRRVLRRS